ncbi:dTDP-4-dehydrorhamnose reductase [Roseomonas hellenica]|uniref:dTDP-4-dehydrorhamnose reductase n=1 Tax=Plastoroseomonas hellenica TaxID=2687306 RepID=A0ABS5FAG3_9PROT|nr:dTDP-4-dehydrorhamnose reductase [Plastoroseomonas hellenica]MBR0669090.1 dTDP-4-dehydrorhamnose reductase [Plastoroseomonas hellenica]
MRRILVTGQGGQLATGLTDALPARDFTPLLVGQPDFDFVDPAGVARAFAAARPEAVVNCAAWTAVDAAEDQEPAAFLANALGPAQLAGLCAAADIPLIQVSTDYVFDGAKGAPYDEADPPAPVSAYGRTKLAGEWAALAGNPRTLVLRTAWVHAPVGRNFVDTMLRLGAEREELRVVADQRGAPTAAPDLADAIAGILAVIRDAGWQPAHRSVFHAVNAGETTWHGFAEAIFAMAGGKRPRVVPIATSDYPTKAHRPADSRLLTRKLAEVFGVTLPSWEDGLRRVLAARG